MTLLVKIRVNELENALEYFTPHFIIIFLK